MVNNQHCAVYTVVISNSHAPKILRVMNSRNIPFLNQELLQIINRFRSYNFRRLENARVKSLEESQETIKIEYKKSLNLGIEENREVFNLALFVLNVEYDVSALKMTYLEMFNPWYKKFAIRMLAVQLYEISEDFPQLLGTRFRQLIQQFDHQNRLENELNQITGGINKFKNDHSTELKEIRNYIGAHRDHNGNTQLKLIEGMDSFLILDLAAQLMNPVSKLTPFLIRLMKQIINARKSRG